MEAFGQVSVIPTERECEAIAETMEPMDFVKNALGGDATCASSPGAYSPCCEKVAHAFCVLMLKGLVSTCQQDITEKVCHEAFGIKQSKTAPFRMPCSCCRIGENILFSMSPVVVVILMGQLSYGK